MQQSAALNIEQHKVAFKCRARVFIVFAGDCITSVKTMPERIYNPITEMGFSAMFTFQLDSTKR